jgi:hypothetical protein
MGYPPGRVEAHVPNNSKLNRKLFKLHELYNKHNQDIKMPEMPGYSEMPITMCSCCGVLYEHNNPCYRGMHVGWKSDYHKYIIRHELMYLKKLWLFDIPKP